MQGAEKVRRAVKNKAKVAVENHIHGLPCSHCKKMEFFTKLIE
jgi:hypothetical protein